MVKQSFIFNKTFTKSLLLRRQNRKQWGWGRWRLFTICHEFQSRFSSTMDSPSNAVLVLGLGRKWYHSLNHGRPKGGFQSKTKPVWCQTTPVGTWGQPNKVNGSLLVLAEGCWEPPCVMVRGLGVDDGTEGFHQCVNGRFIESTLL